MCAIVTVTLNVVNCHVNKFGFQVRIDRVSAYFLHKCVICIPYEDQTETPLRVSGWQIRLEA